MNKTNIKYIKECFKLAERGIGKVSPNPLVGAVLVKDGIVIGKGWHTEFGKPHAEVEAIRNANQDLKGSTLYCNLEPCCHTKKKTPPCVPQIIEAGIKKVVVSNLDPNPEVSGKGIKQLKDAGLEVEINILKKEGEELNKFFFHAIKKKRPYVTLKIAQTLDGKISFAKDLQTWITSDESLTDVHKLRAYYDAVLIGSNTLIIDDPGLNVRKISGRNPFKIILDSKLKSPVSSRVFQSEPEKTILFTAQKADNTKYLEFENIGVKIFNVQQSELGYLNLKNISTKLFELNINSVLVEGGSKIFSAFVESDLTNEIIIYQAPKIFGSGLNAFEINNKKEFCIEKVKQIGKDLKINLRKF